MKNKIVKNGHKLSNEIRTDRTPDDPAIENENKLKSMQEPKTSKHDDAL